MELMIDGELLDTSERILYKYNQPAPRYTSYPTEPAWDGGFSEPELR